MTYEDIAYKIIDEVSLRESKQIMDCPYCKKHAMMLAKLLYAKAEKEHFLDQLDLYKEEDQ